MELNKENIEEQILLYIDAELDAEASQRLLDYIELHPEYRPLLESYQHTIALPEEEIVFEEKDSLLQPATKAIPFSGHKMTWARAASIALLIASAAFFLYRKNAPTVQPQMAGQLSVQPQNRIAAEEDLAEQALASRKEPMATQHNIRPSSGTAAKKTQHAEPVVSQITEAPPVQHIAAIETCRQPGLIETNITVVAAIAAPPPLVIAPERSKLPEWMPLNDEHIAAFDELLAQVQHVKEQVQQKASLLKDAGWVIRIGPKEIALKK